jgi:hypothetical protein
MKGLFKGFFENVKNVQLLIDSYNSNDLKALNVNGHYALIQESQKYKDKNLTTNFTSKSELKIKEIISDDNLIIEDKKIHLTAKFMPNLKGQSKNDFLTPPYELDKKTSLIKDIKKDIILNINERKDAVNSFLLECKDEKILYLKNEDFIKKNNSLTVKEYSQDYNLSLSKKIKLKEKFEKLNEEYLNTEKGKQEYNFLKQYLSNPLQFNFDKEN